ncbi:restriction endonuclease [Halopiger xanaduensis]|uniref:Restriction endonuclease n=1 Tax=Halopiger xanaduensis (strain DSM 18323 / JCM 14033 / SH-6) TaxID=797210 RepID=F8D7J1_HALXS|nr:restriction endonuclease [Halopiger xanaduensis]AEH36289.1 restriction endonuclease [Halopiger xanaduensis SH-6]
MADLSEPSPSRTTIKRHLQAMDNEKFEHFVADLWSRHGWKTVVSQQSRDKSLDVLAEKETPYHQRHAIQAKRYQEENNVGGPKVSEYASLRDQFDADVAVVVTTSGFTVDARERSKTLNVKLIDGDDLVEMVVQADALDLVAEYSDHTSSQHPHPENQHTRKRADRQKTGNDEDLWLGLMILGAVPSTIAILFISFSEVPSDSILGHISTAVIVVAGGMTVVGIYKDILLLRQARVSWHPDPKWWAAGAFFVPYLTVPIYLIRRFDELNS